MCNVCPRAAERKAVVSPKLNQDNRTAIIEIVRNLSHAIHMLRRFWLLWMFNSESRNWPEYQPNVTDVRSCCRIRRTSFAHYKSKTPHYVSREGLHGGA